jgi:branched-chain amino acid transport system ATP-binding protein
MTAALELDELEIRYGAVAAVRRLSLEVGHGEIVGLIGPNGAGKSTTLNAIMGLVPVHGGEIRLAGTSIRGRRTEALVRSGVALVPEGRRIYANLTVAENRLAGSLSGGQQQQLAIARALVARPDVLLLDEPSLGLAPQLVTVVFDVLAQIRERGVTVLLVEQRAQRTVAFADRTYVLSNGELVTTFTPRDADATERLIAAYFGS